MAAFPETILDADEKFPGSSGADVEPRDAFSRGKRMHHGPLPPDGDRPLVTDRRAESSEEDSRLLFACPFYKLDIVQHQKCLRYQLRRIKDVKQHITRQHRQPEFYCARCHEVFTDPARRDDHSRLAACGMRASTPHFDGVSTEQRRQLSLQYVSRGKSAPAQWYYIWETIFPGQPCPGSVYVGNYVEEVAQLLRTVWRSQATEIIPEVLSAASGDGSRRTEDLVEVMESLLSRLVAVAIPHPNVNIISREYMASTTPAASTVSSSTNLHASVSGHNRTREDAQGSPDECLRGLSPYFDYESSNPAVDPLAWEYRMADLQETNGLTLEGNPDDYLGGFLPHFEDEDDNPTVDLTVNQKADTIGDSAVDLVAVDIVINPFNWGSTTADPQETDGLMFGGQLPQAQPWDLNSPEYDETCPETRVKRRKRETADSS